MLSKTRELKYLTQKNIYQIASEVNTGKSYLSDVLNGRRQASLGLCQELQRVTKIHYLYFLLPPKEAKLFLIYVG